MSLGDIAMVRRVNPQIYDALVRMSGAASRWEAKMFAEAETAIKAAAEAETLSEFDSTLGYLEDTMKARGQQIPIVIESVKIVLHEAVNKGIPLTDEFGNVRSLRSLMRAVEGREEPAEKPRRTKRKKRRSKKKR
jgi:hypothetical protein